MKLEIEQAIDKVIQKRAEEPPWKFMVTDDLHIKMADAAEIVFDMCMSGQEYLENSK